MDLINEIRQKLAAGEAGWWYINSQNAYVFKDSDIYGVAIPYTHEKEINERFSNCRLQTYTTTLQSSSHTTKFLRLSCSVKSLRNEFATVCSHFIELGNNNDNRNSIISNPIQWWNKWCELMGNAIYNKQCYSVIAEMEAYLYLMSKGKKVEWTASICGSKDFESTNESFEVKSTIKRYDTKVEISGQHQLKTPKPTKLLFCRMEESPIGNSINDMLEKLVKYGLSESELEQQLQSMGFEYGQSIRDKKYKTLDKWIYDVDKDFPKITEKSFKEDKYPDGVEHIKYTINLSNLSHDNWD